MKLVSLTFENFRLFQEKQTIYFATDTFQNVTLVVARNGLGKTTICNGLLWCLYGSSYQFLDENFSGTGITYANTLKGLAEGGECAVSVVAELEEFGWKAAIKRTKIFRLKNIGVHPKFNTNERLEVRFDFIEDSESTIETMRILSDIIPRDDWVQEIVQAKGIRSNKFISRQARKVKKKPRLPLFLDSPFGLLDLTELKKIGGKIPMMRQQVILLLDSKKLYRSLLDVLAPRIGVKYEINAKYNQAPGDHYELYQVLCHRVEVKHGDA